MLRVFNCGIGMILVVPRGDAQDVRERLNGMGERAYEIGVDRAQAARRRRADPLRGREGRRGMRSVRPRRPRRAAARAALGRGGARQRPARAGRGGAPRDGRRAGAGRRRGGGGEDAARYCSSPSTWRARGRGACSQACLTALGVPPIERRGVEREELAYQVVLPGARIDVGLGGAHPGRVGRLGPREARAGARRGARPRVRGARRARGAARGHADPARACAARRRARRPPARGGRHLRGLPASLSRPEPALARFLEVQVRALSNLASSQPSPEARARLLGAPLEGGIRFAPGRGAARAPPPAPRAGARRGARRGGALRAGGDRRAPGHRACGASATPGSAARWC